jgi:hypothetical protein
MLLFCLSETNAQKQEKRQKISGNCELQTVIDFAENDRMYTTRSTYLKPQKIILSTYYHLNPGTGTSFPTSNLWIGETRKE